MPYMSDIKIMTAGIGTSGVGFGVSVSDVQTWLGIAAAISGIILTAATFYWRLREYRKNMERLKTLENRIEKEDD